MFVLKQTPVPNRTFKVTDTLKTILQFLVDQVEGRPFTVVTLSTSTTFAAFSTQNETAGQAIYRLQKLYGFEFRFKGNELSGGLHVYDYNSQVKEIFDFQKNIISDELEYIRKDDLNLSAIAQNTITENDGFCKDGSAKTKKKRLEVLVTLKHYPKPGELEYTYREIKQGDVNPENEDGERSKYFLPGYTTVADLAAAAYEKLKKYNYTGFKGSFTTFGLPFMQQGDSAILVDSILPERNGRYRIRAVEYTGGIAGLRQIIKLDYKLLNEQ